MLVVRYCGPFEILDMIGPIAYMIVLLASMCVHNVLCVSLLKKYVHDHNHIIVWAMIQVEPKGEFQVGLVRILNRKFKVLQNKAIE
jgi:hypothetical protein